MIELATRLILVSDDAVKAITGDRIKFGIAEEGERRPRIVLSVSEKTHYQTFTGNAGYTTGTIQVDCLTPTYAQAKQLVQAVIHALDGYEGTVDQVPGLTISFINVESENDIPVAVPEGAAAPSTYGVTVNFTFMVLG